MPASPLQPVLRYLQQLHPPAADAELLRRFAHGRDADAFAALVGRHGPMVLGVCRRLLGDVHTAEDAFQTTFLALARQARAIRRPTALPAWLHGIAVRTARHARTRQQRQSQAESLRRSAAAPADPLAEVSGRELVSVIDEELARLPEAYRLPLLLCGLDGLTRDEAGARLGWSLGALRGRLERGRELLRQRLAARGLTVPAVLTGLLVTGRTTAVPTDLLTATVQAALTVAPAAWRLAPALTLGAALFAAVGVGTGLALRPDERPAPQVPVPPAVAITGPRVDRYGDPLPDGAIARVGTNRLVLYGNAAAFSPDGRLIAVGGEDGPLRVWETATGKLVLERRLNPERSTPVTELAFSPDSRRLAASGYWHPSVLLWDVATGQLLQTIPNTTPGQEQWAREWHGPTLAFTPDGQTLLIGGKDGSLLFWDLAAAREIARVGRAAGKLVQSVTVTRDARTALTAHYGGEVHLWDVTNRRHLRRLEVQACGPHTVTLAPDGQSFALCSTPDEIETRDTTTGAVRQRLKGQIAVVGLAYAPDGDTLWVARDGGDVTAWDVRTGARRQALTCQGIKVPNVTPPRPPTEVAGPRAWFSPHGRSVVWNDSGTVRLWDLTTGREAPILAGHRGAVTWASFAADGGTLLTTGGNGEFGVWDAATGRERQPLRSVRAERGLVGSQLSADRRRAVLVTDPIFVPNAPAREGRVFLWDPSGGQAPVPLVGQAGPINLHALFTPDGRFVVGVEVSGRICVYDAATGQLVRTFAGQYTGQFSEYPYGLTPDGLTLVTRAGGQVTQYDFASGRLIRQLSNPTPSTYASCAAISPDGQVLASGHYHGDMRFPPPAPQDHIVLWHRASGQERGRFLTGHDMVRHLTFSPDSRLITSIGSDDGLRLWETATGQERRRYTGHSAPGMISSTDFAPDGRRLATASWDRTALVWQVFDPGPPGLSEAELAEKWADLAEDAATAHRAIGSLLSARSAVPFLAKRLAPEAPIPADRLARLIADLDGPHFAAREEAAKELARLIDRTAPALRQALANRPTLEFRQRAEALLQALDGLITNAELLRKLRAVEALEHIATPAARDHLRALAGGAAGAALTDAAAAALRRLEKAP